MAIRGLTRAIGRLTNWVRAKLLPLLIVRAKYAALCPQTISTPPLGSTAMCGTGAPLPEAIPCPFETFTGAENVLPLLARLLKKMSPPPLLLTPAHATYTPAALTASCGCEACDGRFVVATNIVPENAPPPAGERRKRMFPASNHTTLISPLGPIAIAGISAWLVPERFMGTVGKVCAWAARSGSAMAKSAQAIARVPRYGNRSMLRKVLRLETAEESTRKNLREEYCQHRGGY